MTAPAGARSGPLRITLVNQFYPPDLAPTAHLTASLAQHLADRGHTVTVITGGGEYVGAGRNARREQVQGVEVAHLWTPALGKASVTRRLTDYVTFLAGAAARLVTMRRQDVVISLTTPPLVVVGAVLHRLRHRRTRVVLWCMDCYPDVIERLGSRRQPPPSKPSTSGRPAPAAGLRRRVAPLLSLRRGGPMSRLLRAVNRWVFRHLDHVVTLDDAMRALLADQYAVDDTHPPVTVIPNWEAVDVAGPAGEAVAVWPGYAEGELAGRFVVLYLGNLGYGHRVQPVVDAAATMADDDVAWLFMGGGARWDQLGALARDRSVEHTVLRRPYVAKDRTAEVMAGADCALILLADEALGVMSPSKLHANLAAGLPIVYVGPVGSNVDEAITRFGCGVSLRTDDRSGLVETVRRLRDDPAWRHQLSQAARRAFEAAYCDRATLPRWVDIVEGPAGTAPVSERRPGPG